MKKFFCTALAIAAALFAISCDMVLKDYPIVYFENSSYMIPAAGGELIIPVKSTGVDNVTVGYSDNANWEIESNGDKIPTQGWVQIVKVIDDYQSSRALATWTSGIVVVVEPNNSNSERRAAITVTSLGISDAVTIVQPAALAK